MKSKIKLGVSLYSYQIETLTGQMNLEDCIEAVSDMGAEGIEIIPQSNIPNCYNIDKTFLDKWYGWMEKYGTKPVALDSFCEEMKLFNKRGTPASFEERLEVQKRYIDLAAKLGCKNTRSQIRGMDMLEALVPYAEEKDVRIGQEIHAPGRIKSKQVEDLVEFIERTGTKHVGFVPDFGIYQFKAPPVVLEMHIRDGANRSLVEYAAELAEKKTEIAEVMELIKSKGGNDQDLAAARRICSNSYDTPDDLRSILPYVLHFHGKFWDMGEDLVESCIDYENPVRILIEEGFDGYINSEYEGNRHIQDLGPVRGVEQVRRHHAMIRNIIDRYAEA